MNPSTGKPQTIKPSPFYFPQEPSPITPVLVDPTELSPAAPTPPVSSQIPLPTPAFNSEPKPPTPIHSFATVSEPDLETTQRIPQIIPPTPPGQVPTDPPQGFYFANSPTDAPAAPPLSPTPTFLTDPLVTQIAESIEAPPTITTSEDSLPRLVLPSGETRYLPNFATIGRATTNFIFLDDGKASREHTHLTEVLGKFQIKDNQSTNGTYLNEMRLVKPTLLRSGDRIRVGKTSIIFLQGPVAANQSDEDDSENLNVQGLPSAECWLLLGNVANPASLIQAGNAERYVNSIGQWFEACRSTIQLRKGDVNKTTSNGFLAYWRDDQRMRHAEMAASLQVLCALRTGNHPSFRMIIHVGQASMAINHTIGEQILRGPEVHRLYQVEKTIGYPNLIDIIATAEATARLKSHFIVKELGLFQLPGVQERQNLFGLTKLPKEMQPPPAGRI